jgi:hypothetical protein
MDVGSMSSVTVALRVNPANPLADRRELGGTLVAIARRHAMLMQRVHDTRGYRCTQATTFSSIPTDRRSSWRRPATR